MKTVQMHLSPEGKWLVCSRAVIDPKAQLALVFWSGMESALVPAYIRSLRSMIPEAVILGCSTGGIIQDRLLLEEGLSATLVSFQHSRVQTVRGKLSDHADSRELGEALAVQLPSEGLVHVWVLSDGLKINGSQLAHGLAHTLGPDVTVTGGLASDGIHYRETYLLLNEEIINGEAICLGFYGDSLHVGYGSQGGFEPFGPERLITASDHNILYEIDGESALALYERYLGKHARNLPASGHLFPLGLRSEEESQLLVRSIMGVDREHNALMFSGDMPLGAIVQFMKANMDSIIDGAKEAAIRARLSGANTMALLVSCMGRKQALRQFTEEEIDAVHAELPAGTALAGFYSYGEIAPNEYRHPCLLHNQTMTVTVFGEEE